MVVVVAVLLSGLSTSLKPRQDKAIELDKKFNILNSVTKVDKENAIELYNKTITEFVIDGNGKNQDDVKAFDIKLRKELAKSDPASKRIPLYVYNDGENKKKYILPMHGNGLWDFIGGFLALEDDFNTVAGTVFTHVAETPGLGAEITQEWFNNNFKDEQIMKDGKFVGIKVLKGKGNPKNAELHMVDGMSGATITGDGIQAMIDKCVRGYLTYFKSIKNS